MHKRRQSSGPGDALVHVVRLWTTAVAGPLEKRIRAKDKKIITSIVSIVSYYYIYCTRVYRFSGVCVCVCVALHIYGQYLLRGSLPRSSSLSSSSSSSPLPRAVRQSRAQNGRRTSATSLPRRRRRSRTYVYDRVSYYIIGTFRVVWTTRVG